MLQQLTAILAVLITTVTLLSQSAPLFTALSSDGALPPSVVVPSPSKPSHEEGPVFAETDDGGLIVNGFAIGTPLDVVRQADPEFPAEGQPILSEIGTELNRFVYKTLVYDFRTDTGELYRIELPFTPKGRIIAGRSRTDDAYRQYGKPLHGYKSNTGSYYGVFDQSATHNLAWVFQYDYTSRRIDKVILCGCRQQMIDDAAAAAAAAHAAHADSARAETTAGDSAKDAPANGGAAALPPEPAQ